MSKKMIKKFFKNRYLIFTPKREIRISLQKLNDNWEKLININRDVMSLS